MKRRLVILAVAGVVAVTTPMRAEPLDFPLACEGSDPDWYLSTGGTVATFDFGRRGTFDIRQSSHAEGRDWPRAYTLIAEFDTAILVLDEGTCQTAHGSFPIRAHVLTQRGETPILLTGCCTVAE